MTALFDAIERHADAVPDAVAIEGEIVVTWRMLADMLPALGAALRARFPRNRPIAVRVDHGAAECVLDLALIVAGLVTIPLPPFFTPA